MVVEDVNSGAVHLDVVSDNSTNAVLLTLRRYGSLRGWPGEFYSDPGSHIVSASVNLKVGGQLLVTLYVHLLVQRTLSGRYHPLTLPGDKGKRNEELVL